MKKLLRMLVVAGMLISAGGCGFPEHVANTEFNKRNVSKLEMLNQRQQYFKEHLNLSPQMKQYITSRDKSYFKPLDEKNHVAITEFNLHAAESIIGWIVLGIIL